MNVLIRIWLVALLVAFASLPASAASDPGAKTSGLKPSFDCETARHAIEKLVCDDPDLTALDVELASVFSTALKKVEAMPNTAPQVRHLKAYELRWSRQRNDCARRTDAKACAVESYRRRIADLQARYLLVRTEPPVFYVCRKNPRNELIATYMDSDPLAIRLDHAGKTGVVVAEGDGTDEHYAGARGIAFAVEGDKAFVTWPKGTEFECLRQR